MQLWQYWKRLVALIAEEEAKEANYQNEVYHQGGIK